MLNKLLYNLPGRKHLLKNRRFMSSNLDFNVLIQTFKNINSNSTKNRSVWQHGICQHSQLSLLTVHAARQKTDSLTNEIRKKNDNNKETMRQITLKKINQQNQNRPAIYTDGSIINNTAGIGIYIKTKNSHIYQDYKIKNYASITTAELIAIHKALKTAEEMNLIQPIIYTDSLTSCNTIRTAQKQTQIEEIIYNTIKTAIKIKAEIIWIPSHVGIRGNEIADELAKKGTITENYIDNKYRYSDVIKKFQNEMENKTKDWYKSTLNQKGKKFAEFQKEFKFDLWYKHTNLTAQEVKIANKIIAGHDLSEFWLHKMKIVENGNCDKCNEANTGWHKIFVCPNFNRQNDITVENLKKHWQSKAGITIKKIVALIKKNKITI